MIDHIPENTMSTGTEEQRKNGTPQENPYERLRTIALEVTPEQLGLQLPADRPVVFGIVMDWNMGEGIVTVVAYLTGDASMYLSTGGGIIGGGRHADVRAVAVSYVRQGADYIGRTVPTGVAELPEENHVRFHLLTNRGVYTQTEAVEVTEDESSDWYPLFIEANRVLTALRMLSEGK